MSAAEHGRQEGPDRAPLTAEEQSGVALPQVLADDAALLAGPRPRVGPLAQDGGARLGQAEQTLPQLLPAVA